MPSKTKQQATLMAMAAHNRAFAKKRGIPMRAAREFNRADKGTGILKRKAGGPTPLESGLDSHLNFGMGHGRNFFSTTPLMGHAMSGTPLGGKRFADGGKVSKPAKPAGPNAKERREIRALVERGKQDAVAVLRASRDELLAKAPAPADQEDFTEPLEQLRHRLTMADGGQVQEEEQPTAYGANPVDLYQEYLDILAKLQEEPNADQGQLLSRIAEIEQLLGGLGIDLAGAAPE